MLLADFALAGLPNPAAKPLDLAIQREQGSTSAGRRTNNTLREDYQNWLVIGRAKLYDGDVGRAGVGAIPGASARGR